MLRDYKNDLDQAIFNNPTCCRHFKIEYDIKPQSADKSETGGFFNDQNSSDDQDSDDKMTKDLYEPFVPSNSPNTWVQSFAGTTNQYNYEWYSHDKYPMGTIVHYQDKTLTVKSIVDHSEDFGIYMYYLQDWSDNHVSS